MAPAAELLTAAISHDIRPAASRCVSDPVGVVVCRARARAHLTEVSKNLASKRATWAGIMPEGSPARALNLPLIAYLVNGLNYDDTDLVKDLTMGMGITGDVPATNTLRPRTRVPRADHDEWAERIPQTNRVVVDRVMGNKGRRRLTRVGTSPDRRRNGDGFPSQPHIHRM